MQAADGGAILAGKKKTEAQEPQSLEENFSAVEELIGQLEAEDISLDFHNIVRNFNQHFFLGMKIPVIGSSCYSGSGNNIGYGYIGKCFGVHEFGQGTGNL